MPTRTRQAVTCGFPKHGGKCRAKTKDPSGQCRHHRGKDARAAQQNLDRISATQSEWAESHAQRDAEFSASGTQNRRQWERERTQALIAERDTELVHPSELTGYDIRGVIDRALDAQDGGAAYHETQEALGQDALADEPIVQSHEIGMLIRDHFDGDVRVLAIRHPNADMEQIASIAASESEPKVIVDEAQARLDQMRERTQSSSLRL